ncbi:unnamed protein product [Symbiodinium necroappetens]|uniref:Uncharacterized protein n=1 Tax=Symbiodinium necroappetens TaxID=1628268 RepID=A0A813CHG0_9DINO|nr:unnamed protein product [Symbiodinium necroappetens]
MAACATGGRGCQGVDEDPVGHHSRAPRSGGAAAAVHCRELLRQEGPSEHHSGSASVARDAREDFRAAAPGPGWQPQDQGEATLRHIAGSSS